MLNFVRPFLASTIRVNSIALGLTKWFVFFAVVFSPRHSPNFVRLCARLGENICFRSPFPYFRPDTRRSGSARRRRRSNKDTIKPCAMQIYLHGRGEVSRTKSKIRINGRHANLFAFCLGEVSSASAEDNDFPFLSRRFR